MIGGAGPGKSGVIFTANSVLGSLFRMFSCFGGGEASLPVGRKDLAHPSSGMPDADENGYYFACMVNDVGMGGSHKVKIGSKQVVLFKVKTDRVHVYAMANSCVHQGTALVGKRAEGKSRNPPSLIYSRRGSFGGSRRSHVRQMSGARDPIRPDHRKVCGRQRTVRSTHLSCQEEGERDLGEAVKPLPPPAKGEEEEEEEIYLHVLYYVRRRLVQARPRSLLLPSATREMGSTESCSQCFGRFW